VPVKAVLIYDRSCSFCRRWVERLKRWDRRDALIALPLQDPSAPAVAHRKIEELRRAVHLVTPEGEVFAGARAAREVCRYLPGGRLVRLFFALPGAMPVAERVYRWISRRYGPVKD
jgi:predicted DCC family thiol-disulfide oxidoreductase YuxK